MSSDTIDDPVFGQIRWKGLMYGGWAGQFSDALLSKSTAKEAANTDDPDEPADQEEKMSDTMKHLVSSPEAMLEAMAKNACQSVKELKAHMGEETAMQLAKSMIALAQFDVDAEELEEKTDAQSGSLRVVINNSQDSPPTALQQKAWSDFQNESSHAIAALLQLLFEEYRQQREERRYWWARVYGDSSDSALPEIARPEELLNLIEFKESRVFPEFDGHVYISLAFNCSWDEEGFKALWLNDHWVKVDDSSDTNQNLYLPSPVTKNHPRLGELTTERYFPVWSRDWHIPTVAGWWLASLLRYQF